METVTAATARSSTARKGAIILEREQVMQEPSSGAGGDQSFGGRAGGRADGLNTQASGPGTKLVATGSGEENISRGYAEELEHWAWCIPQSGPRTSRGAILKWPWATPSSPWSPKMAAREGKRIEFKDEWFQVDSDETPEGIDPVSAATRINGP